MYSEVQKNKLGKEALKDKWYVRIFGPTRSTVHTLYIVDQQLGMEKAPRKK